MTRKSERFRQIKPAYVRLGDLIRVTGQEAGVQRSRTGIVANRTVYRNNGGVELTTAEGGVLLTSYADGSTDMPGNVKVTLIQRTDTDTLPGLEYDATL